MGIDLGVHEHVQGRRRSSIHRALRPLLMAMVLIASFGCEGRREHETTSDGGGDSTAASTESRASAPRKRSADTRRSSGGQATNEGGSGEREAVRGSATTPAPAGANHVRLVQRGCVQFDPQWTTLQVGQTLTWHSELGVPVTIHVPAGAFGTTEYIVRAGQSLTTGPARAPGTYAITSEPNACQGAPLGPRGSSPGVTIAAAGH
jgi:plastocyanin